MDILKHEINQSNAVVINFAKWKLTVVAAVVVVSLGWIDTTREWHIPSQAGVILIYSIGLICAYIDWMIYRRYTVIHTIANYLHEYGGDDEETNELKLYEIHMRDIRNKDQYFLSERYTHFCSSILISIGSPALLLFREPFEWPGFEILLVIASVSAVIFLFDRYDRRRHYILYSKFPSEGLWKRVWSEVRREGRQQSE